MGGTRQIDKIGLQVLVEKLPERQKFGWRKRIDRTDRRLRSIYSLDLKIEFAIRQ
jgi:hypothetical protein